MIYLIISSIVVFMVCFVIILQKQAKQKQKDIDRPWRVVKNALGQYLVQNYKVVKKFWNDANPFVTYEWKWVTVETFDDEQAAIIKMNYELEKFNKMKETEKIANEKMAKAKKEKELAETIVEIIK